MASRTPLKNRPHIKSGQFQIVSSPIKSLASRNKSISIESSPIPKHNSVKKSKSSLSLKIKDKISNIPKPQELPPKTLPKRTATMSQSSSLLLDYIKECKYNKSPNDSLEYGDELFGDYKASQEEVPTAKLVFRSSLNSYSEIKTSSQNNFDGEGLGFRTPFRDHNIENEGHIFTNGMTNEEISPIKKNSGNKPLSYNEASLKQLLKRTLESSPGGYPNKILERRTSAKKKDVPTFFFNLPDTRVITEKGLITDITDNPSYDFSNKNDQSLSILYSNERRYNGYNEPKINRQMEYDRNQNNHSPFKQQYSLLKITSMELTPTNNDENNCVQYSQPDEVKTTVGNVTEPNDPMIRLNTNPSKMTLNVEKPPKRPLGNKKRQNSCSFPKKPPTHNNTSNLKPSAKVQKPKEQPLSRKNSTQFFQNKNFSFEMTYFKPIDESKLDEYIHSVNVSRGVISPLKGSTPENSPLKKRASESRERKVTENKLNYSQDILSHHRGSLTSNNRSLLGNQHKNSVGGHNKSSVISHSNKESVLAKPKEEEKKIEKSPQKKITTKSSDQKVKVVNVKVNQGNNPGSRLNTVPSKSNISISKNKSKVPSTNQQPQSEQNPETCSNSTTTSTSTKKPIKKSGDSSRSRSSSKTKTSISQKAKKVVRETEDGNTYSKLDRLLQDLKTNITRTTKEDESCTNTGTPSEVGLFNQSLNSEQHKEQETSGPVFPQKSLKKTLIAALEKQ